MFDLETLDTVLNSVILSVGAVAYDSTERRVLSTFYTLINTEDQMRLGRSTSPRTLEWWEDQELAARKVLDEAASDHTTLRNGLRAVRQFVESVGDPEEVFVWANPSSFDISLLDHAYQQMGQEPPWHFYNVRCYRTFREFFPELHKGTLDGTTPHNALDDARIQADHLATLFLEFDRIKLAGKLQTFVKPPKSSSVEFLTSAIG